MVPESRMMANAWADRNVYLFSLSIIGIVAQDSSHFQHQRGGWVWSDGDGSFFVIPKFLGTTVANPSRRGVLHASSGPIAVSFVVIACLQLPNTC